MTNKKWLIAIFVLLGSATLLYFLTKGKGETSTLGWDRKFKIENRDDIQKIFIAQRNGETTTLERSGNHWNVDGSTSKASPNAVENLLEAITMVELKYVPPQTATDNIVKELGARGIKVEIYNKKGEKMRAYYVGGTTPDARGTYMILENAEQPMVMEIPTMEGQIRTRYELKGDDWRDRSVFAYEPEDIQAVSIEYPQQRNKSFRLNRDGQQFKITPFYENTPPINTPIIKANVETFLIGFESLVAESFSSSYEKKDSVRATIPFSIITVKDNKGGERKAALYPTYSIDTGTGERTTDIVERYFADVDLKDWMVVQHRVFQKIFWPYQAFFEPGGEKVKN
jgi:hypothetical protein